MVWFLLFIINRNQNRHMNRCNSLSLLKSLSQNIFALLLSHIGRIKRLTVLDQLVVNRLLLVVSTTIVVVVGLTHHVVGWSCLSSTVWSLKLLSILIHVTWDDFLLSEVKFTSNDARTLHVTLVMILWIHHAFSSLLVSNDVLHRGIDTSLLVDAALASPWNRSEFIH